MKFDKIKKPELRPVDDLFGNELAVEKDIIEVRIDKLHGFRQHPFQINDDYEMDSLVKSIEENGIMIPVVVRPDGEGYEILAGHRRTHAAKLLGLEKIPAIVKEMDDDAATILMVDSNLQREHILPSEKAKAYKMRMEAMKRQAGRKTKEQKANAPQDQRESREILAEQVGESAIQIQRYIRLNYLSEALLNIVDEGKIPLNAGVALSYLTESEQAEVLQGYRDGFLHLNLNTSNDLKNASKKQKISDYISAAKDNAFRKAERKQEKTVAIPLEQTLYQKYFSDKSPKAAAEIIATALARYFHPEN